jgi:hypothetical protein
MGSGFSAVVKATAHASPVKKFEGSRLFWIKHIVLLHLKWLNHKQTLTPFKSLSTPTPFTVHTQMMTHLVGRAIFYALITVFLISSINFFFSPTFLSATSSTSPLLFFLRLAGLEPVRVG